MADTLVGHSLDQLHARQAFKVAARRRAGLSWGDPAKREAFVRCLPFSYDTDADEADMAGSQSCCATACMGALDESGFDGTVSDFRRRAKVNPLRAPYADHYDGITYLGELARQTGARREPGAERPDIRPGSVLHIGGGDDGGGAAHILMVVDVDDDGTLVTVEGGKVDPLNPKPSPKNCTLIADDRRELVRIGGAWWCRDAGGAKAGRKVRWWFAVEDLPLRDDPEAA